MTARTVLLHVRELRAPARAARIDPVVLAVAGVRHGVTPAEAIAHVRAKIGERAWTAMTAAPPHTIGRALVLLGALAEARRRPPPSLRSKLAAAVRAGKYAREDVFDIAVVKGVEVLTPKAWAREMAPAAVDAMIDAKQERSATPAPALEAPVIAAAVRDYARRRGITDEAKIAAIAAHLR